ncbi:hypothetical protein ACFYW8_43625 [Streptomyces sp. NPDC002742]|uniref:hypothetical protein n=1 Tax=Streptomyces sp. NPDC002742 TaxID=3364663 RepID=UPI003699062D
MTGVEIAVGYVFVWLLRKAKRVGERADAEVDRSLDAGMSRLHDLVSGRLCDDPALTRAAEEAEQGLPEPTERTRRQLTDSLEEAAERDSGFAQELEKLVKELQNTTAAAPGADGMAVTAGGTAVGGNVDIHAESGSAAALTMGDVSIGSVADPRQPGSEKG